MTKECVEFIKNKIWMYHAHELPPHKRFPLNIIRIALLASRMFTQNECPLKASALTFYTLFSVVPVAALIFGIAQGYGFSGMLEARLKSALSMYPEAADKILAFAYNTLQSAKGGVIAGIGVLLLLWTTVKLLSNIENTLNGIWGVAQGRSIVRKITDYIAIVVICPILLITAASAIVLATTRIGGLAGILPFSESFSALFKWTAAAVPVVAIWIVLTFIYIVIPNTKVRFSSAATSAFFATLVFAAIQALYVFAQVFVAKYNTIYGSFAALPLLLLWLNVSWMIILAGAELSFAIQNVNEFEMQPDSSPLSQSQKNIYAFEIVEKVMDSFNTCSEPPSDIALSNLLEIPIRSMRGILFELVKAGLLDEVVIDEVEMRYGYRPAMPPEIITPALVAETMNARGGVKADTPLDVKYKAKLKALWAAAAKSDKNTFKD